MSDFSDVGDFHEKFGLHRSDSPGHPGPQPVSYDLLEFRFKFMHEELKEFMEGMDEGDDAKMFDALMDLTYVAMGTAHLLGYPWEAGWRAVQTANMAKERAAADGSNSKRGSSFDVVKPEGWTAPDIEAVLASFGFTAGPKPERRCPNCMATDLSDHEIISTAEKADPFMLWCPLSQNTYEL